MAKVVKVIELLSESPKSWEDAAENAVREASRTLRNIRSLYVEEMDRGSRERKDHKLPAKFESDSGIRKHAER